jgi:hypothetical protein
LTPPTSSNCDAGLPTVSPQAVQIADLRHPYVRVQPTVLEQERKQDEVGHVLRCVVATIGNVDEGKGEGSQVGDIEEVGDVQGRGVEWSCAAERGKTSIEGMPSNPFLKGVQLIWDSFMMMEEGRTIGEEGFSRMSADYVVQAQAMGLVMGLVEEKDSWNCQNASRGTCTAQNIWRVRSSLTT